MGEEMKAVGRTCCLLAAGLALGTSPVLGQATRCSPQWAEDLFPFAGVDAPIHAMTVFDDGNGSSLYAGGEFLIAGSVVARGVARWDGKRWSSVGSGLSRSVHALAAFDDGTGPTLYAGGTFTWPTGSWRGFASWDGQQWSRVGDGVSGDVNALAVFDDGSGTALYVGGSFGMAAGKWVHNIASWDGQAWSSVGGGLNTSVYALTVYDLGTGPGLYAGGAFTLADGAIAVNRVARWDGTVWTPLGEGIASGAVRALTGFDDGAGRAVYVGGLFVTAGGMTANRIARWDGQSWSPLAQGFPANEVRSLFSHDDDDGPALYAGGSFTTANGAPADRIARWKDGNWTSLDTGPGAIVLAMVAYDDGSGPALHAAGRWRNGIAKWNGESWWWPLREVISPGSTIRALAVLREGASSALYAVGTFVQNGSYVERIGRWDGDAWAVLDADATDVSTLGVFDGGTGENLYAGGSFTSIGGTAASKVAQWSPRTGAWSALGPGLDGPVTSLLEFDDGSGAALYVGGEFFNAGSIPAARVARWDGAQWLALPAAGAPVAVQALAVADLGHGPQLYAGAIAVHRLDGQQWTNLGAVTAGGFRTMVAFEDDGVPGLYIGGHFNAAGGVSARRIARWNGSEWSSVGGGRSSPVRALAVFDDGAGPALYAGGDAWWHLSRWDGQYWTSLGTGVNHAVRALAASQDPPVLYVAGSFTTAGGHVSPGVAVWGCAQPIPCYADCDDSGTLTINDFLCFIDEYAAASVLPPAQQIEHYANCDGSTSEPVLTLNDFLCFIDEFAQGCP